MRAGQYIKQDVFANAIRPLKECGAFIHIPLCLCATHGRHAGELRDIVRVVLTHECAMDLMIRLQDLHG
jgi:hypothetical protein